MQSMARWRFARCGLRCNNFENRMTIESQIEKTYREEHGRVLAALISQLGDFELAEDAMQDALVNALERWEIDGVPRNPGLAMHAVLDKTSANLTLARLQVLRMDAMFEEAQSA